MTKFSIELQEKVGREKIINIRSEYLSDKMDMRK